MSANEDEPNTQVGISITTPPTPFKYHTTRFDKPWYKDIDFYKMCIMLAMILLYFVAEITVGLVTNSLTLVADSFHMLSDAIGILVGLLSLTLAKRKGDEFNTYGYSRAEPVGGLINSVFLLSVVFFIVLDAIQRFFEPESITDPLLVLLVGIGGLVINFIGLILFCGHAHHHGHDHGHSHDHDHHHGEEEHSHHDHDHHHHEETKHLTNEEEEEHSHHHHGEGNHSHAHHHHEEELEDHHHHGEEEHSHHDHEHHHEHSISVSNNTTSTHSHHTHNHGSKDKKKHSHNDNLFGVFLHVLGDFLGSLGVIFTTAIIMICRKYFPKADPYTIYIDPIISLIISFIICTSTIPLFIRCCRLLLQSVPQHIDIKRVSRKLSSIEHVINVHELHVWSLLSSQKVIGTVHLVIASQEHYHDVLDEAKSMFHQCGIHSFSIQVETSLEDCRKLCNNEQCIEEQCCL